MENIYEDGYMCGFGGYGRNPYKLATQRREHCVWQEGYNEGKYQRGKIDREENRRKISDSLLTQI